MGTQLARQRGKQQIDFTKGPKTGKRQRKQKGKYQWGEHTWESTKGRRN